MKQLNFILLLFITIQLQSQVIPSQNRVDWSTAGSQFSFPEPKLKINIMNFGAHADGLTDDATAVNNAIASLNGNYGLIFFPAGKYLLQSGISLPDSVIIRGAGSDSTFIKFDHITSGFSIYGQAAGVFTPVITGFTKDSKIITVTNASLFSKGDYVELREENGSWDTNPATWATYSVGQITKVDSVFGNTLFFEDKLRITFDTALHLEIRKIVPKKNVSIECLNVERINTSTASTGYNFDFNYAADCRVKGVESNKSHGSHCMINLSTHIEVSGSYFHDAYMYDGTGTKGYGVTLNCHAGLCLITNNIFKHLRHAMMTKHGANGNVFSYNYSIDPFRNGSGEFPADLCGDISAHGHYSFANLFEGNIVQTIYIDNAWGPSGPYNTFFRNRTHLYGIIMTTTLTDYQNFVGNEIIGTGFYGNYTLTGLSNFEHGNNKNGTITPTGTTTLSDASYYLSKKPYFWTIADSWPSVGIGNTINTGSNPAKTRYVGGKFTDCSSDIHTNIEEISKNIFSVYPNPVDQSSAITIEFESTETLVRIELFDINGKVIKSENVPISANQKNKINYSLPKNIINGIYLLKVNTSKQSVVKRLVKM